MAVVAVQTRNIIVKPLSSSFLVVVAGLVLCGDPGTESIQIRIWQDYH